MIIQNLIRENIKNFTAYRSARDEYSETEGLFLDANENALGSVSAERLNRYPDPNQRELKQQIARIKNVDPDQTFLGNGSDEAIDLLFRAFCRPGLDKVMLLPPTYGMYAVCAALNDIEISSVPLSETFAIDLEAVKSAFVPDLKMIFICSPNNPSGNLMDERTVRTILEKFRGLVVIDEAYADFSGQASWLEELDQFKNLVILQTFSKAWGMANARLGMAFAHKEVIAILNKIKYPYNVNGLTQKAALEALKNHDKKNNMVSEILECRQQLQSALKKLKMVDQIFPSQANFLLVRFKNASKIFNELLNQKIIVRDRSNMLHCQGCLRITVGTADENRRLLKTLMELDRIG